MLHPTRSPANWPLLGVSSRIDAESWSLRTVRWTALLRAISLRLVAKQDSGRIPESNISAALELAVFGTVNARDSSAIACVLGVAGPVGLNRSDVEAILRDEPNRVDYESVSKALSLAFRVYVGRIEEEARRCDAGLALWRSPARRIHLGASDRIARWSAGAPEPRMLDLDSGRVRVAFSALERTASELLSCLVVFAALTNLRLGKKEPAGVAVGVGAGDVRMVAGGQPAAVSSSGPSFGVADPAAILSNMFELAARAMAEVDKTIDRIRLPLIIRTPREAE